MMTAQEALDAILEHACGERTEQEERQHGGFQTSTLELHCSCETGQSTYVEVEYRFPSGEGPVEVKSVVFKKE